MRRAKRTSTEVKGSDGRAGAELAWLVSGCVVMSLLAMRLQLFERITDWSRAFDLFELDGLMALLVLVPVASTIYSYRRYQDAMEVRGELARLSLHDSLTGLPNRLYLHDWLDAELRVARRNHAIVAVLFIDLDRFKIINDTYGHEIGDQLMVAVAARLRKTARSEDRLIRYGGDEFVMICPGLSSAVSAERLAGRLIEALEAAFTIGTETMRISTSIGIALSEHGDDEPEDLLREADIAMYQAKSDGTGNYRVFDTSSAQSMAPVSMENRLRTALTNHEFVLHYQPVVDVRTGRLIGVESLIRWDDPERGLVPPGEFIPLLEETGLIVPVGTWVLQEACRQQRRWLDRFPDHGPMKVTVNVSARQLAQSDFQDVVTDALRGSGAMHNMICLEITEGALMYDVTSAWAALRHAKSLGVQLALDDFGTGYSSLSYIRRFSLDMLKIDRSFIDGLGLSVEDTAIVEHVVGMAKALGMVVVGEGIEQPAQLRELQRLGCDLAQGYFFSKPLPVDQLDALIADPERTRSWAAWAESGGTSSTAGATGTALSVAPAATQAFDQAPAAPPEPAAPPPRPAAPPVDALPPAAPAMPAAGGASPPPPPVLPRVREVRTDAETVPAAP